MFGIDKALSNNGYFKFLTSLDISNFNNKLDWNKIKYSSTNSPMKDSVKKYNQINLGILCKGYIAKGFWKRQFCSQILNGNLRKCCRQLQQALMQTSFYFHNDDIFLKIFLICEVKMYHKNGRNLSAYLHRAILRFDSG